MLAVRKLARGSGNVRLQEVPEPTAGPGDVIIEVAAAGICGTDLHIWLDEFDTEPPVTLGHEVAGSIAEIGPGVDGWAIGDRVTTETYFSTCQTCNHCRRGRPNLCAFRRSIGSREDGAFARFLRTPARNLHRLPADLPLEAGALVEPLACVVHGVIATARVNAGDQVVISGPGPIGLLTLMVCKAAGASVTILGTAADHGRLQLALALGADHAVDIQVADDPVAAVRDVMGVEGADLAIECSGATPAGNMLLNLTARGGRYSQMGLYGKPLQLDLDLICYREIVMTGSNATVPTAWPRAIQLLAEGHIDHRRLITHRYGLADWEAALETVRSKDGVKVLLTP